MTSSTVPLETSTMASSIASNDGPPGSVESVGSLGLGHQSISTDSGSPGGMEELLPLVLQLTNPDQVCFGAGTNLSSLYSLYD